MLKGIDPLLTPELLKILTEMGHGDAIAVVDANFTAATLGRGKPVVRLPGAALARAAQAILSVLPLDLPGQPVAFMAVEGHPPGYRSPLQQTMLGLCASAGDAAPAQCQALERYSFYDEVGRAYAIVQTGELQTYANFLFRKGVIGAGMQQPPTLPGECS